MHRLLLLRLLCACLPRPAAAGEGITEQKAEALVRALPEVKARAAVREMSFGDNVLITNQKELPATVTVPAWMIDVRTVVHYPEVSRTALWYRFVVSSSGAVYVRDGFHVRDSVPDKDIPVDQWRRTLGKD